MLEQEAAGHQHHPWTPAAPTTTLCHRVRPVPASQPANVDDLMYNLPSETQQRIAPINYFRAPHCVRVQPADLVSTGAVPPPPLWRPLAHTLALLDNACVAFVHSAVTIRKPKTVDLTTHIVEHSALECAIYFLLPLPSQFNELRPPPPGVLLLRRPRPHHRNTRACWSARCLTSGGSTAEQ